LSLVAKSPCRYQPNLPKAEVDAGFALQVREVRGDRSRISVFMSDRY